MMFDFIINLTKGNLQICATQLLSIRECLDRYERLLSLPMQMQLYYHIGIYYFLDRDFRETLDWVAKIQQLTNHRLFPDSQRFCKLMELMAWYELEEYEYLESVVRKMYRKLKQKPRVMEIESLVLKSVKQLLNVSHSSEVNHIFASLYDSLQKIDGAENLQDNLQTNLLYHWIYEYLPQKNQQFFN